ncbi:GTPase domain-containing protein [Bradyrhizobium sp. AUGA SZCCT0222]|uniref:GTPase domain-containing protein n=1 Tax=Bradyrhizobium sp. AUGA SZCCT0222 TaxID=2807668 RepID=UPI001BA860AC|nr:GTPase domain-containing protein [Bradyrhizobium sp. AUGA SZCCT0222]MBR1267502.1 GTPase domain-containing protein [Bradyrhizobium sp. AUGA SZCCT0222]
MSKSLLSIILALVISGSAANYSRAQPKQPAPPAVAQPVLPDITKIDRGWCEKLIATPLVCQEGVPGVACRSVKDASDVKCKEILKEWSIFDYLPKGSAEKFVEYAALILFAVFGLAVANLVAWINARKSQAIARQSTEQVVKLENRALDPFFNLPVDFDQHATNMILIGEGGSGKTTLLHALSGAAEAKPDVATAELCTYTLVHEVSIEQKGNKIRRLVRIYSDDYVGQNWVQGAQNALVKERQKLVRSSTLVIVVDLVGPGSKTDPAKRHDKAQSRRIREQLEIYNDPAIQNLAHLLGSQGQIILFINKIDLIYPITDERIAEARLGYKSLIDRLGDLHGIRLRVIVGSAVTGLGVVGYDDGHEERKSLLKLVIDHAEKIDVNQIKVVQDGKSKP